MNTNYYKHEHEFYNQLVAKLKNDQMEHGEFGVLKMQKNNITGSYSKYYESGRKPNVFITRYAMELLFQIDPSDSQIKKALGWIFYSNINISKKGFWIYTRNIPTGIENRATGEEIVEKKIIDVYRHTAEALTAVLLADKISANNCNRIKQMIENLLDIQDENGSWSITSDKRKEPESIATSTILNALTNCDRDDILDKLYSSSEKQEIKIKIETAISKAIKWLIEDSERSGGLWSLPYEGADAPILITAAILKANSSIFGNTKHQEFTASLISRICSQSNGYVWFKKNGSVDISGTAQILAGLFSLGKHMTIDNFDLLESRATLKEYVLSDGGIDKLDSVTLCYLVDIFSVNRDNEEQPKIIADSNTFVQPDSVSKKKKIFISYSRKDVEFKDALKNHLNVLSQLNITDNWSCEDITIGNWNDQIQRELNESDVIIYMLSANFFSSAYILEKEVMNVMNGKRDKKSILCVVVSEFLDLEEIGKHLQNGQISDKQKAILMLKDFQYLPYAKEHNPITKQNEEKLISLKKFSNDGNIEVALTQITKKILSIL